MKGYKVFNSDWICRDFQYKVGITYEMDEKPKCCEKGFHFCEKLIDCFDYYSFNRKNKVAEVEALGEIDRMGKKACTNIIEIVRELSWEEVLRLVNLGDFCVGKGNIGEGNVGDKNCGSYNIGSRNAGDSNSGSYNSGSHNNGRDNSGNKNNGSRNSGNWNAGNYNSGSYNIGNSNSGYCNNGDWNTGDWNKTNFSNGCFNTEEQTILMFNKPSSWTLKDWRESDARFLLDEIQFNRWILSSDMTYEEKDQHPEYITTDGYLKEFKKHKEDNQTWWDNLSDTEKDTILSLPNFDTSIFKEITGIDVSKNAEV